VALRRDLESAWQEWRMALAGVEAGLNELRGQALDAARKLLAAAPRASRAADAADLLEDTIKGARIGALRPPLQAAAAVLADAEAGVRAAPLVAALGSLVAAIDQSYAAAKRRAGALDFSDLLVRARDLLRDDAAVREATRARFDAVLVDEFQDTNPVQAELVELVAGPPSQSPEGSGRRFVVGDRKQSIYEFRGADVGVFTRTAAELVARGGREELLQVCRRATPALLRFDNALFAKVMAPLLGGATFDWALAYDAARDDLQPFRDELPGGGAQLITIDGAGGESEMTSAKAREREAAAIAARICELHGDGRRWGDIAILLRRFTALGDYLEALRAARVPHYVVRGRGFFAAQEVRDVASALTLLDDPEDRLALVSVLRSPFVGLSDESLARLALDGRLALHREPPPDLPPDERARLDDFRARFDGLRSAADRLGPAACVRALVDGADLAPVLATTREGEQRVANLERLVERARGFEARGGDLRAFVAWLRRVSLSGSADAAQAQVVDERDDVVRVMTIHQAKGLEFPVVFVPACGAKEVPDHSAMQYDADAGLGLKVHDERSPAGWQHTAASRRVHELRAARRRAESLRLFYVAATRAKDLAVFSGEEPARGGPREKTWRSHLNEVSPELLIRIADSSIRAPAPREEGVQFSLFADGGAERALARVAHRPPPRPLELTCAVTQLADFQLCPRRYFNFHSLGLAEHPAAARAPEKELGNALAEEPLLDSPLGPLRRGTLAHRLLERSRFGEPNDLEALLAADGYDPAEPAVAEVRSHVSRFLEGDFARGLTARRLRRELPFLLSIPLPEAGCLHLRGQIDLLILDEAGVTVLDYKHARAGDPDDYRFQLDAYALAARRLYPAAPSVSVGLVFLKEADPTPHVQRAEPTPDLEERLSRLGAELAQSRATDAWPGRPLDACRAIRCGYVYRCHSESTR
jgi:ATP-dependent helicase/nuclease subunit A